MVVEFHEEEVVSTKAVFRVNYQIPDSSVD